MAVSYVDVVIESTGSHTATKLNLPVVGPSATTIPLQEVLLPVSVGNASTNLTVFAPFALKVIGAKGYKTAANGGAGDLVQVFNGATAVTDAIDLNIVDTTMFVASTIDDAANSFAEGDTITIDPTDVTNPSCQLYIVCVPQ